jgi:hypothetical protein
MHLPGLTVKFMFLLPVLLLRELFFSHHPASASPCFDF